MTMTLEERYLKLLRCCLTRGLPGVAYAEIPRNTRTIMKAGRYAVYSLVQRFLRIFRLSLVQTNRPTGETMVGLGALENLHSCMMTVLEAGTPGDFVETGVWRGGSAIYMRAFLSAYGDQVRHVWAADSFEGLPKPKDEYKEDRGSRLWSSEYLAVSVDEVRRNFAFYDQLDDRVHFLKGFFSETMPVAPIEKIAVLRLDGDMYESTIVVLRHLYPKLSCGGFVIVDDYGMLPECNRAVEDYRSEFSITDPIEPMEYVNGQPLGACWRKR